MAGLRLRGWSALMLGVLLGAILGSLAFVLLFGIQSAPTALHALPVPRGSMEGAPDPAEPKLGGNAETILREFEIHDLQGNRVLHVNKASTLLDLAALHRGIIRMPRGRVTGVELPIRRGNSGRVSLAEVFAHVEQSKDDDDPQPAKSETSEKQLELGPFQVRDARIKVALIERPLIFHVDRAVVRIERAVDDTAPRIFLSQIHGYMVEPDPLPQPVRIEGGEGVVDLARDPLLDLRVRACIGGGEMRVRVGLAKQRRPVSLRADGEGFTAQAAVIALGLVARFKDEKLSVTRGSVELADVGECSRAEGREKKEEIEDEE